MIKHITTLSDEEIIAMGWPTGTTLIMNPMPSMG